MALLFMLLTFGEGWKGHIVLPLSVRLQFVFKFFTCSYPSPLDIFLVMPPTLKKLEGHIASGSFICPSVCPCITLLDALHNF